MTAIFKREFKSYFTNMIGYVIVAVLCLLIALYFCLNNVGKGYPYFAYALNGVIDFLMIIIPILTMRCLSDERKSKTDQLLLTSPASITQIVMGKYLGMVSVFAIPVVISCIYPIILSFKESHSMIIDFSTILAFFLFGCVYIAIGMFVSSLTESQIISAVVTFVVFFIFYLMSSITGFIPNASYANAIGFTIIAGLFSIVVKSMTKNLYAACMAFFILVIIIWGLYGFMPDMFIGAISKLLTAVSFSDGLSHFASGIFDVKTIVMFISMIVLFVFLTVQSIQKRRYN